MKRIYLAIIRSRFKANPWLWIAPIFLTAIVYVLGVLWTHDYPSVVVGPSTYILGPIFIFGLLGLIFLIDESDFVQRRRNLFWRATALLAFLAALGTWKIYSHVHNNAERQKHLRERERMNSCFESITEEVRDLPLDPDDLRAVAKAAALMDVNLPQHPRRIIPSVSLTDMTAILGTAEMNSDTQKACWYGPDETICAEFYNNYITKLERHFSHGNDVDWIKEEVHKDAADWKWYWDYLKGRARDGSDIYRDLY